MRSRSQALLASCLFLAGCQAKTEFTGDVVDGHPVITKLDLADVPCNNVTRYMFRAGQSQGTFYYDLPVMVARGNADSLKSGRKLALSSSVHGDELTGIRVIQTVFGELEEKVKDGNFNGTVIGLPVVNPNGVFHNQRNFWSSSENGFLTNMNRVFPGKPITSSNTITNEYAFQIWNGLWGNTSQVDIAVDMHTLTIASAGPLWCYADYRLPGVQRLAELTEADIIKVDPGEPGTIETSWVSQGVPAITYELGSPKIWDKAFAKRGHDFIFRLLADLNIIPSTGPVTPDLSKTYVATNRIDVGSTRAGFADYLVNFNEDVQQGQEVVRIYNTFGDLVESVKAPASGRVLEIRTDAAVEQGSVVIVVVNNGTST
jgi:predicted deacylase